MDPVPTSQPAAIAAGAVNALGIELLRETAEPDGNALLSPYSVQCALAMTYAGAGGDTRAEMAKVLHYPQDEALLRSFTRPFSISMRRAPKPRLRPLPWCTWHSPATRPNPSRSVWTGRLSSPSSIARAALACSSAT